MNWKKITNLEGLPESGDVILRYSDDCIRKDKIPIVKKDIASGVLLASHWCLYEPPKPQSDDEGFGEWFYNESKRGSVSLAQSWLAALAWERSKTK